MIQEPFPNSVRGKQRIWQRSKRLQDDWMLQVATVPHKRIAGLSQRFQVSPIIINWGLVVHLGTHMSGGDSFDIGHDGPAIPHKNPSV